MQRGIEMTREEEWENFAGPLTEEDDYSLCVGCHEYPCCCTEDDKMLQADWEAEIAAKAAGGREAKPALDGEPECNCYFSGDQADASDCPLHGGNR